MATATWLDVFPWLDHAVSAWRQELDLPSGLERWDTAITLESALVDGRAEFVTECALDLFASRWSISELFPSMAESTALSTLGLSARAESRLAIQGCATTGDLAPFVLSDLMDIRGMGSGTVQDIVDRLVRDSIRCAHEFDPAQGTKQPPRESVSASNEIPVWKNAISAGVHTLAVWNVLIGRPDDSLVQAIPLAHPAENVAQATIEIASLTAHDVLTSSEALRSIPFVLGELLGEYDDRMLTVLRDRFFADKPETLDKVGLSLGVTRERARQMESRARTELVSALHAGGPLAQLSRAVREAIGVVRPLDEVLALFPALADNVDLVGQPAWRVIDRIDDEYEIEDGWCFAPSRLSAVQMTWARLEECADESGLVEATKHGDWFPVMGQAQVTDEVKGRWAEFLDLPSYRGFLVTRTKGLGDWAVAILAAEHRPMTAEEIIEVMPISRTLSSLRNQLGSDPRIRRIDRSRWALASWGLKEYRGIRELIRAELAASGGSVRLETLVSRIGSDYSVSDASVRAYAMSHPFVVEGGVVTESTDAEVATFRTVAMTKKLYAHRGRLALRVTVNADHLRGSGFSIPSALAGAFGLQPGTKIAFSTSGGEIFLRWSGIQPSMSSIRGSVVALDCVAGDEVLLWFGEDRTFSVTKIEYANDDGPAGRVARLMGFEFTGELQRDLESVASALAIEGNWTFAGIVAALGGRGEADVLELLIQGAAVSDTQSEAMNTAVAPGVEEILNLL